MIFVGEKPSRTAYEKGWTWEDGRLAGKQLFDALAYVEIDPKDCRFVNLFGKHPDREETPRRAVMRELRKADRPIVAMGQKVSKHLARAGIEHKTIVHPAARGKIRGKLVYQEHVKEVLNARIS
jgi:uracil-DNA glycosylase